MKFASFWMKSLNFQSVIYIFPYIPPAMNIVPHSTLLIFSLIHCLVSWFIVSHLNFKQLPEYFSINVHNWISINFVNGLNVDDFAIHFDGLVLKRKPVHHCLFITTL